MNSAVTAAIISIVTLIGTLAAQYFGRRATSRELGRRYRSSALGR